MDKKIVISGELLIQLQQMNLEMHFRDIFDFVLGNGEYEKMVSDIGVNFDNSKNKY